MWLEGFTIHLCTRTLLIVNDRLLHSSSSISLCFLWKKWWKIRSENISPWVYIKSPWIRLRIQRLNTACTFLCKRLIKSDILIFSFLSVSAFFHQIHMLNGAIQTAWLLVMNIIIKSFLYFGKKRWKGLNSFFPSTYSSKHANKI